MGVSSEEVDTIIGNAAYIKFQALNRMHHAQERPVAPKH
jgi:hypothetical protein